MESVAMVDGLFGLFVRTELAVGADTTAWAQGQAEFLATVVAAGRHPHLAAIVRDVTPTPEGAHDLIEHVLPRVITGLLASDPSSEAALADGTAPSTQEPPRGHGKNPKPP